MVRASTRTQCRAAPALPCDTKKTKRKVNNTKKEEKPLLPPAAKKPKNKNNNIDEEVAKEAEILRTQNQQLGEKNAAKKLENKNNNINEEVAKEVAKEVGILRTQNQQLGKKNAALIKGMKKICDIANRIIENDVELEHLDENDEVEKLVEEGNHATKDEDDLDEEEEQEQEEDEEKIYLYTKNKENEKNVVELVEGSEIYLLLFYKNHLQKSTKTGISFLRELMKAIFNPDEVKKYCAKGTKKRRAIPDIALQAMRSFYCQVTKEGRELTNDEESKFIWGINQILNGYRSK